MSRSARPFTKCWLLGKKLEELTHHLPIEDDLSIRNRLRPTGPQTGHCVAAVREGDEALRPDLTVTRDKVPAEPILANQESIETSLPARQHPEVKFVAQSCGGRQNARGFPDSGQSHGRKPPARDNVLGTRIDDGAGKTGDLIRSHGRTEATFPG